MMFGVRKAAWTFAAACALVTASTLADNAATFQIRITLSPSGHPVFAAAGGSGQGGRREAVCTSQAEALDDSALVQVLCTVGPFVTISHLTGALPGAPAADAYRYNVEPGSPLAGVVAAAMGIAAPNTTGTVTALQVSNATGHGSAIEMLVSF